MRIRAALKAAGKSQRWLAGQIGMKEADLSKSLNNQRKFTRDEFGRIEATLSKMSDEWIAPSLDLLLLRQALEIVLEEAALAGAQLSPSTLAKAFEMVYLDHIGKSTDATALRQDLRKFIEVAMIQAQSKNNAA